MNWEKCMKNFNCKTCSDYKYCKDDVVEKKNKKKKGKRKDGKRMGEKVLPI